MEDNVETMGRTNRSGGRRRRRGVRGLTCSDAGWPVELLGIVVFFHVCVEGVDDGLSEVNHGVLILPIADDLVLLLDVDKLAAPDG